VGGWEGRRVGGQAKDRNEKVTSKKGKKLNGRNNMVVGATLRSDLHCRRDARSAFALPLFQKVSRNLPRRVSVISEFVMIAVVALASFQKQPTKRRHLKVPCRSVAFNTQTC
jgi:hypothetical protein